MAVGAPTLHRSPVHMLDGQELAVTVLMFKRLNGLNIQI